MRTIALTEETRKNVLENLLKRSPSSYGKFEDAVAEIVENVRNNKDAAVFEYTKRFDGADINARNIKVTKEEIDEAYEQVDPSLLDVIRKALVNIREYHEKQKKYSWFDSKPDGTMLGQKVMPLAKVGVYVPGGKAVYPSSVLMNVVPAKVAGVEKIIMTTPCGKDGKVYPSTLVAAMEAGADEIYKVGGAQAIAALAFGTESIPKVDKIVGPGNIYVALAKKAVYGHVSIDSIAGPSEILVIESMLTIGLKEFQLCVGNVDFFQSLIEDASLDEEAEERVRELIGNRNYFGVEEFLDSIQAKRSSKEAFSALNELIGGIDILEKAENLAPNSKGVMAIRRLEKIYHILRYYGVEKFVTFDLSMTGTYGYYTGIVFRGYTYGTGDAFVKGGRYDHLIEKFGKKSPSIGFAIVIDELVSALTRQKIRIVYPRKNTIIIYAEGRQLEAIRLAKDFRRKAKNAELLKKDENSGLEDYIRYGNDYYAGSLVYIEETGEVTMVNLVTG